MKPDQKGVLNKLGKQFAAPLSCLAANSLTENWTRLFEAYLAILLGKGAGTGWLLQAEISAANHFIKNPIPFVFDVGANNGEWSHLIQKLHPQSKIFLFEPLPDCQKIIRDKKIQNSELIPMAVGSENGLAKLYVAQSSGISSLHQRNDSYFKDQVFSTIDVQIITLDSVIEKYNLQHIDFVKMDIEGHELQALVGAKKSLEKKMIGALSFEFGAGNINSRTYFRDFWNFLTPLGYRIYRILPSTRLMYIKEYYEDCEYFRGVSNYIAAL